MRGDNLKVTVKMGARVILKQKCDLNNEEQLVEIFRNLKAYGILTEKIIEKVNEQKKEEDLWF
jgi:hypothetical protein